MGLIEFFPTDSNSQMRESLSPEQTATLSVLICSRVIKKEESIFSMMRLCNMTFDEAVREFMTDMER